MLVDSDCRELTGHEKFEHSKSYYNKVATALKKFDDYREEEYEESTEETTTTKSFPTRIRGFGKRKKKLDKEV